MSYDELIALNAGFNRWATDPGGPQRMLVPIDNADAFEAGLTTLPPNDRVPYLTHVIRSGRMPTLPYFCARRCSASRVQATRL